MAGSEDSKIKNLIATIILCTTLSTLSFIGRLRGRLLSAVRLGWDDLFMALAVIIATSRLDFEDITWSNVEVAIWNMVEVHIGCVTANIPVMAPLASRFSTAISRLLKRTRPGPISKSDVGNQEGFRRMEEQIYRRGATAPTIGKGQQLSAEELEMAGLGTQGILVRKEVEQNSHPRRSLGGGLVDMVVESA
ncbi:MAG: hypothetical protein LQ339_006253 [Xanthoria mediterranea]|nr:MAG: hypothetical protein LQ339_006253 [Xanthoria mediterranea]